PWTYVWIGFNGIRAERLFSLSSPILKCSAEAFGLIRRIPDKDRGREELAAAAGMMLLSEILTDFGEKADHVSTACNIIESMYMTDISVAEIAERLGLDRRYLCRIFREKKGITVMDFIIGVRMEAALRLLCDGMSVSRTAELVGYCDPFYFSKSFKKHFGFPPSAARRRS
ncbi:MAG: helix-turn-helix domain-containing protein, partial [Clostridia bacterium]|nr:helix-turn-helix domain-containing protein [Clostridia bacterium]